MDIMIGSMVWGYLNELSGTVKDSAESGVFNRNLVYEMVYADELLGCMVNTGVVESDGAYGVVQSELENMLGAIDLWKVRTDGDAYKKLACMKYKEESSAGYSVEISDRHLERFICIISSLVIMVFMVIMYFAFGGLGEVVSVDGGISAGAVVGGQFAGSGEDASVEGADLVNALVVEQFHGSSEMVESFKRFSSVFLGVMLVVIMGYLFVRGFITIFGGIVYVLLPSSRMETSCVWNMFNYDRYKQAERFASELGEEEKESILGLRFDSLADYRLIARLELRYQSKIQDGLGCGLMG